MKKDVLPPKPLTADMMGSTAHLLFSTHHHGKVFTSVSDTIYMLSYDGNLFWVTSEKIPLHGRSIRVKGKVPQIAPGTSYTIQGDKIHFENGVEIDLSASAQIQLGVLALQDLLPLSSLFNKTEKIYQALSKFPLKGFGQFIPDILANVEHLPFSRPYSAICMANVSENDPGMSQTKHTHGLGFSSRVSGIGLRIDSFRG
jgi:hypothetical protein